MIVPVSVIAEFVNVTYNGELIAGPRLRYLDAICEEKSEKRRKAVSRIRREVILLEANG